ALTGSPAWAGEFVPDEPTTAALCPPISTLSTRPSDSAAEKGIVGGGAGIGPPPGPGIWWIGQKPMILLPSTTAGVPMSVDLHGGALEDQLAVRLESDLRTAEGHLALGIDDDRTLRLDDELLVEGVEPDGHLALGGRQCDPGDVLRIEQRHAMAETGDDLASRHSAVVAE